MEHAISITVREALTFHSLECRVFERLLPGRPRAAAKNVVTLWLWLEQIGFHDLVATATNSPDRVLVRYVREGEAILDVLCEDAPPPANNPRSIPLTAARTSRPVSLRFFYVNRDAVIKGMSEITDGVGRLIFDDRLRDLMRRDPNAHELCRPFVRGRPAGGTPENQRTMFLMFTRNQPLSRGQLLRHFTSRWGDCIERVIVESTTPGVAPIYGRMVFKTAAHLDVVLNGSRQTEFVVAGRQMWGMRPMTNRAYGKRRS